MTLFEIPGNVTFLLYLTIPDIPAKQNKNFNRYTFSDEAVAEIYFNSRYITIVQMMPRRVTFNADANILYSQIKGVKETQSTKNGGGLESALVREVSLNGKGFDAESTATASFEKAMINRGANQDSSNFTDRQPLKYVFTTNGRRR